MDRDGFEIFFFGRAINHSPYKQAVLINPLEKKAGKLAIFAPDALSGSIFLLCYMPFRLDDLDHGIHVLLADLVALGFNHVGSHRFINL